MTMNMGTPNHPEGVPHWSAKELIGRAIRHSLDTSTSRQPRSYASMSIRMVQTIVDTVPGAAVDWNDTWPFWYVGYNESPHDGCEGGITLIDLAGEVGNTGEVRVEGDWLEFWPDIAMYREGSPTPAFVLEVVDTSEPSQRKIDTFKASGVEAYKVDLKGIGNLRTWIKYNPMLVQPLVVNRCGKAQRDIVKKVIDYWDNLLVEQGLWPWVGYYHYPTGVRQYGYGGVERWPDGDNGWAYGDREVIGLQRDHADWGQPMRITPEGRGRTLSKKEWLDCLAYLRLSAAGLYNQGKLDDPFMIAIGKYGAEVMTYAYP